METSPLSSVDFQARRFVYRRPVELDGADDAPQQVHPVVVVGAGPVGLATAIDLAQQGIAVVLIDNDDTLSSGSRAICFAKRTLEIFDRLQCGAPMLKKGVSWNVGKVFLQDELIYSFNLQPETGHAHPAFVNLQQYYVEGFLVERAQALPNLDIRWKSTVTGLTSQADGVELQVETDDGTYTLHARYVVAADGARSPIRQALGLDSRGRTFKDRFLIADVRMKAPFPTERWFWFDPPFHRNQSVLLHKQPDNVWRIDFQLGWDADPTLEKQPERVIPRVKALLGEDAEFELEWVSVYTFSCLRMDQFRHQRVLFAGDSAHGVSPFGARGANSGVQDADNLAWKLRLVLQGLAPDRLLDTYATERQDAADENILNSTRATDFITPKTPMSRVFRDATLKLAKDHAFARRIVNSGRLSVPTVLANSSLNTADVEGERFDGVVALGGVCADAPVQVDGAPRWLLPLLSTGRFAGVYFAAADEDVEVLLSEIRSLSLKEHATMEHAMSALIVTPRGETVSTGSHASEHARIVEDVDGVMTQRFDAKPGSFYLIRPDQHLCARWRHFDVAHVRAALTRATCNA